jgi:hypothetical protein
VNLGCLLLARPEPDHYRMSFHRVLVVAATAGLSLVAPSAARADWSGPAPVTGSGQDAYALGVAANDRDRPAVLYQRRHHGRWTLALRRTGRGGRLGRETVLLRSRHSVGGEVFAGRGDDLVAGWLQIINGSRRPVVATGPRLQDRQVLAPGPRSTQIMRLAVNRRGDAIAAFWRYSGSTFSILASFRPAGGRFGAPQSIVVGNASFSTAAIDQHGNAAVGWTDNAGVHVAVHRAGAASFDPPVLVAADAHLRGDPGVAIEGDHVVVSWITEDIDGNRTLLVSERTAQKPFGTPVALTRPGVRLPRWLTPSISLSQGRALVAWVQGKQFTSAHDVAAVSAKVLGDTWTTPILRAAPAPSRVYAAYLLGPTPTRPAILGLTTANRGWRFGVGTATLRGNGTLGPVRVPRSGRTGGFRPFLAQGGSHTWLVTERDVGHDRLQRRQVLLFKSNR